MTKDKTNSTELAIWDPIDLSELTRSVEKLAITEEVSNEEKERGVEILHEWEESVLNKMNVKIDEINSIRAFIRGKSDYAFKSRSRVYSYDRYFDSAGYDMMKEQLTALAEATEEYESFQALKFEYEAVEANKPDFPIQDPMLTAIENDVIMGAYELNKAKWTGELRKAEHDMKIAERTWLRKIRTNDKILRLLGDLDGYSRQIEINKEECRDLSTLARLNISISNEKTREALKEILEFGRKLKTKALI